MNACTVIDLELAKARRIEADQFARAHAIAMRKRETVDELVDALGRYPAGPDRRREVIRFLNMGWATDTDMQLALEALG